MEQTEKYKIVVSFELEVEAGNERYEGKRWATELAELFAKGALNKSIGGENVKVDSVELI